MRLFSCDSLEGKPIGEKWRAAFRGFQGFSALETLDLAGTGVFGDLVALKNHFNLVRRQSFPRRELSGGLMGLCSLAKPRFRDHY